MKRRPSRRNRKLSTPYATEPTAYANEAEDLPTPSPNNLLERISNTPPLELGTGIGYYGYTYATAKMRLSKAADATLYYLDTRCLATLLAHTNFITTLTSQEGHKLALQNGVTVYSTSDVAHHSLASLVDEFPNLWKNSGFIVNLPPKE
jgi:hypothetical protein